MKRLLRALICIFVLDICVGWITYQDSFSVKRFTDRFDTTVNLTLSSIRDENADVIQRIAKEHHISMFKEKTVARNSLNDRRSIEMYVFLDNTEWFEKSYPNIIIEKGNGVNSFGSVQAKNILTRNNIVMLPFSEIASTSLEGDYHIHADWDDINEFVESINEEPGLNATAAINQYYEENSTITTDRSAAYILLIIVVAISIMVCCEIYSRQTEEEIAVAVMLGYRKAGFAAANTARMLCAPAIMSLILINVFTTSYMRPASLRGYLTAVWPIMYLFILVICILAAVLLPFFCVKANKIKASYVLKGADSSKTRSTVLIKIVACSMLISLSVSAMNCITDYNKVSAKMSSWENNRNYVSLSCNWPWIWTVEAEKFDGIVAPRLDRLWDALDDNGAVLFQAPYLVEDGMDPEEYMQDSLCFGGRYAFINSNYLKINDVFDKEHNALPSLSTQGNEWIVLVPENIPVTDEDRRLIHDEHEFETADAGMPRERYISIEKGQMSYCYNSERCLMNPLLTDCVLIVVDGKNLVPENGIKLPSLINGDLHPYVSDPENAYDELRELFSKEQADDYIIDVISVYDEASEELTYIRDNALLSLIEIIMIALSIMLIIIVDTESYISEHRRRIIVSHMLGYGFREVHGKRILRNAIVYSACILAVPAVVFIDRLTGLGLIYIPRAGWDSGSIMHAVALGVTIVTLLPLAELKIMYKKGYSYKLLKEEL